MLIETLVAARDVGRLNTIAGVLIRHGLGDVVHRLGLAEAGCGQHRHHQKHSEQEHSGRSPL